MPLKIFTSILFLMLLMTPWWAIGQEARILGLPSWVVYVVLGCVIFPLLVSNMIGRWWETLEQDGEDS
ncbi:MAG: hypothetical protein ACPGVU_13840 [Limisphaerales bacterium]